MKTLSNADYFFVYDLETLGLERRHQITQFGGVLLDGKTLEEVWSYKSYFRPRPPIEYQDQALEVTGLTIEFLQLYGVAGEQVCNLIAAVLPTYAKAARISSILMNKTFDSTRLEDEFVRYNIEMPWSYSNKFDIRDMAVEYDVSIERYKLQNICEYFGIPYVNAHDALVDARLTAECFRRLEKMRHYMVRAWKTEAGSQFLQNLRKSNT